jgi:dolichol kinase
MPATSGPSKAAPAAPGSFAALSKTARAGERGLRVDAGGLAGADTFAPARTAPRVTPQELRRRLVHMLPGTLPFLLWRFPHRDPVSPTLKGILTVIITGLAVVTYLVQPAIARRNEHSLTSAILGYALVVLSMVFLFPAQLELAMACAAVIAFGDGAATLAGLTINSAPLPWNAKKTWAGTLGFVLGAVPVASLVYWGEAQPGVTMGAALCCVAPAALAAAVAESWNARINDNIRVGLTAAMTIAASHAMFVGW